MNEKLVKKFFEDPDWKLVEAMIMEFIHGLEDPTTIDTRERAEDVKAEIVGRKIAKESMMRFLTNSGMIRNSIEKSSNECE